MAQTRASRRRRNSPEVMVRSEEHTSELQSQFHLVCRLLHEKKKVLETGLVEDGDQCALDRDPFVHGATPGVAASCTRGGLPGARCDLGSLPAGFLAAPSVCG